MNSPTPSHRIFFPALVSIAFALAASSVVLSQSGGSLDLRQNVIAGGGNTSTGSGNMRVDGTVGQPAAGKQMTGGTLMAIGGFWPPHHKVPCRLSPRTIHSHRHPRR